MRFSIVLALALLCASSTAYADTLRATRMQPLRESSHAVDVRVKEGVATYTVRRSFSNLGTLHEEAQLSTISKPMHPAWRRELRWPSVILKTMFGQARTAGQLEQALLCVTGRGIRRYTCSTGPNKRTRESDRTSSFLLRTAVGLLTFSRRNARPVVGHW